MWEKIGLILGPCRSFFVMQLFIFHLAGFTTLRSRWTDRTTYLDFSRAKLFLQRWVHLFQALPSVKVKLIIGPFVKSSDLYGTTGPLLPVIVSSAIVNLLILRCTEILRIALYHHGWYRSKKITTWILLTNFLSFRSQILLLDRRMSLPRRPCCDGPKKRRIATPVSKWTTSPPRGGTAWPSTPSSTGTGPTWSSGRSWTDGKSERELT